VYYKGNVADQTNSEFLTIGFISGEAILGSVVTGTGTVRPIHMYTGSNANQLYLGTNGSVLMNGFTSSVVGLTVKAAASQTNDIFQGQDSIGNDLFGADERGVLYSDGGSDASNLFIGKDAGRTAASGTNNVAIGESSLVSLTSGVNNVAVGGAAGLLTEASSCFALGSFALQFLTTGNQNVAIGTQSSRYNETGINNIAIGYRALQGVSGNNHSGNVAIGTSAGLGITTGLSNVFIGPSAGFTITSGSTNIFIGKSAGYRQTTNSNLLIIDNTQRADTAAELTNAIIYGVMAAAPASQTLRINAYLGVNATPAAAGITLADANDVIVGASTGSKIGTATGQKLSFWGVTPVVQQVLATGAGASVDNVISLLQTLGLCKQSA